MCGIAGIVYNNHLDELENIHKMTSAIQYRGPDDSGMWIDLEAGVAFGHRRLSIIDLSAAGHQPMHSPSKRYAITYNGEIYNYLNIQKELAALGANFIGHSDTEVLLSAIEAWGVLATLKKMNGMFAFAVWDRKDRKLYLSRDRFGEKPLYYGWINGVLIFGSELKALRQYNNWHPEINRDVIGLFLRYGYIPAPYSIYKGIFKIKPGSFVEIFADGKEKCHIYWDAITEAQNSANKQPLSSDESAVISGLHNVLLKSTQEKCISDVPLGVFLSSGIDSSLVAALMQENNKNPIKTFTIGFNEKHFNNEAPAAKKIAEHLGTDHHEFYVTEKDAKEVVPKLPFLYDEPFADSSQIPTHLVSTMARAKVKVCLSGDGGDELFGGYNRYVWLNKLYKNMHWLPKWLMSPGRLIKDEYWDTLNRAFITKVLPKNKQVAFLGQKINKVLRALQYSSDLQSFYVNITSIINNPNDFLSSACGIDIEMPQSNKGWGNNNDFIHWMMLTDTINYLPGDVLVKVDRASMGVSLETRAPFLDKNVFEFAWQLPLNYKIRNGQGKYMLRQLLSKYIPQNLIERPKVGFGVPVGSWIKNDLREWAEDLLSREKLQEDNIFAPDLLRTCWEQHLSGKKDWTHLLWNFLMFQAWLQENK